MTVKSTQRKIVVPFDGSESALRALRVAAARKRETGAELHVLNVQPVIVSGNVRSFVSQDVINRYYEEEAATAMAPAHKLLESEKVPFVPVTRVGHPFEVIAEYADPFSNDEIVMGSRGMSSLGNLVLGSVATKVIHVTRVPVTLVK